MYNYVELTQVTGNLEIKCIQVKFNGKQRFPFVYKFCENV